MRTIKCPDERMNEILDAAERLFVTKGYEHTTVNDILSSVGIAKGALYYYYKSKEDVLDGIIKRRGDVMIDAARLVAERVDIGAKEKLLFVMLSQKPEGENQKQLADELEKNGGGQMFLKSLLDIILRLAPIIGGVIEQGIAEGVFSTPYPLESAEILLSAAHSMFDNGGFNWTQEETIRKTVAFITVAERVLGAAEGSLLSLTQLFE